MKFKNELARSSLIRYSMEKSRVAVPFKRAWLIPLTLAVSLLHPHICYAEKDGKSDKAEAPPLLLVLSFDGLRADFLNEALTPNLWKLARKGVLAPNGIKAQVVTETTPNYYTMATGLYQENHGIIGNTFYDPVFGEKYDYWKLEDLALARRSRDAKWYSGEPIWQTNENAGHRSGGMRWPLCDIRLKNGTISRCFPWEDYGDLVSWTNDLDQLLHWFTDKKEPINLGFLYISEPDHTEHENDIYSAKVKAKLAELDAFVWSLMRKLQTRKLQDRMNILFVSDHGHVNVHRHQSTTINLDDVLDPDDCIWSSKSIFPNTRKGVTAEALYKKLHVARMKSPRFDLWWKHQVPDRYHYKNNRRIGPIVLIERLGYAFAYGHDEPAKFPIYGTHGYLNDYFEMRPAFFAVGPAFKRGLTIDWEIENVDLYSLMATVLRLQPAQNNGNFTRVSNLLQKEPMAEESTAASMTTSQKAIETAGLTGNGHGDRANVHWMVLSMACMSIALCQ